MKQLFGGTFCHRIGSTSISTAPARTWLLALFLLPWLSLIPSVSAVPVSGPARVLILDESVDGGINSEEAIAAQLALPGCAVDFVNAANWPAVPPTGLGGPTGFGLDSYRAVIIGDPMCTGPTTNGVGTSTPGYLTMLNALNATKAVWTPVITGNVILEGVDNALHGPYVIGADKSLKRGIGFAVNDPNNTGLYYALSCYYDYTAPATNAIVVPHLTGFGTFKVRNYPNTCFNDAHIVATHPVFTAAPPLTDTELSNWGCSTHEGFDQWPPNFVVLAIALTNGNYTATDGSNGIPYIVVRGQGIEVISSIVLGPPTATNSLGTTHTVCATLATNVFPRIGVPVTFTITAGPNSVTNYTAPTDTNGVACFTWSGIGGPGVDYVSASYPGEDGQIHHSNIATKYWETDCIGFGCEKVECLGEGAYQYSFCITNYTFGLMNFVSLQPQPGVTFSSNFFNFSPPLYPNTGTNISITVTPAAGATNFCFDIISGGGGGPGGHGCDIPHCVPLPNCCNRILTNTLTYTGSSGLTSTYAYQLTIQNIRNDVERYVVFAADQPCVTFNPSVVDLALPAYGGPSLLYPFATRTFTVQVQMTAPCPTPHTFTMSVLNTNLTACCSDRGTLPKARCVGLGVPVDGTVLITNMPLVMRPIRVGPCAFLSVSYYAGSAFLGASSKEPYEVTFVPEVPGAYEITAVATLETGEVETSDPATVTVIAPGFDTQHTHSPVITAGVAGDTVLISVPTVPSESYVVEYRTNLVSGQWQTLGEVQGDGTTKLIMDSVTNDSSRFYRTRRKP